MIYPALKSLVQQLNDHLRYSYQLSRDIVFLAPVFGDLGTDLPNRVCVSVVGFEKDNSGGIRFERQSAENRHVGKAPKWQISLHFLVSVLFKDKQYAESVQILSGILTFLQRNTMLTVPSTSKKYAIEPINMSYSDQASLWSMLDTPYHPSVLCQMRMITVEDGEVANVAAGIGAQDTSVSSS